MRIEMINNSNAANSLSVLNENLSAMISQSETTLSSLQTIKQFSYSMNGGVGSLQNAVDFVSNRMEQEETTKNNLIAVRTKLEEFLTTVQTIDAEVSEKVTQNEEEFYRVTGWKKPAVSLPSKKISGGIFGLAKSQFTYQTPDISKMSDEELQKYYQEVLERIQSGNFSEEDKAKARALLIHFSNQHISETMTADDKKKIKMFNELYETLHPDERDRIENIRKGYQNDREAAVYEESKYMIYSEGFRKGKKVSDNFVKNQFYFASKFPKSLYYKLCYNQEINKKMGSVASINEVHSGEYYHQGTTHMYNFNSKQNEDGSKDVSFSLSNDTKRYTEITVYNSDGTIQSREYLEGQKDPSSIIGVFGEFGKAFKDIGSRKAFRVDADFFNSKQDYSYHIPEGGYIKITEDPSEMNQGSYYQQIENSMASDAVDLTMDTVDVKTGNPITDLGSEVFKNIMAKKVKDNISGNTSSPDEYKKEVVSSIGEYTIDTIATAGEGNPAGFGMVGIKAILKWNSANEQSIRSIQQNKSKGNHSLYIYN